MLIGGIGDRIGCTLGSFSRCDAVLSSGTCTWPAFTGVVTLVVLTGGAVEAGSRVTRRQGRLAVSACEGCVRAVTAVAETKIMSLVIEFLPLQ